MDEISPNLVDAVSSDSVQILDATLISVTNEDITDHKASTELVCDSNASHQSSSVIIQNQKNACDVKIPLTFSSVANENEPCSESEIAATYVPIDVMESLCEENINIGKVTDKKITNSEECEIIKDLTFSSVANKNEPCSNSEMPATYVPVDIVDLTLESLCEKNISIGKITDEKINAEECGIIKDDNQSYDIQYDFQRIPLQVTGAWSEFKQGNVNNFTRGCKWAPDGSCILTCSDDNILRLFNLPHELWDPSQWQDISEMESVVKMSEGGLIYDYCWYPLMNSGDPRTCCLVSSSKDSPVHMWDGFSGELRCSYRSYNHVDELVAAHSMGFDADGQRLFCGFEKIVRVFNIDSPGRNYEERNVFAKKSGQSGIISCFAFTSANRSISAAGSYAKTVGLYSEPSGCLEHLLDGPKGGITQIQFSSDGTLLYSGGRKDCEILCWDLRNLGCVLYSLQRSCITNQRMYFDVSKCGRYVFSGNHNGVITIWDVTKEPKTVAFSDFEVLEPIQYYLAHDDCVNGISLHPYLPLLCSSSGERKFPNILPEEEEHIFSHDLPKRDNSLRLWWLGKSSEI